jgi:predicted MFS family arabinose efflux permease
MEAAEKARGDGRTTITSILLVITGMQVFIIQPEFIHVVVDALHLSDAWAGYIAASEMAGIAAATLALSAFGQRVNLRVVVTAAACLLALANLLSILATSPFQFTLTRGFAGLGAGALISVGYSIAGSAANPDRAFGFVIMALLTYGAIGVFLLPGAAAAAGISGIMIALAVLAASSLFVLRTVPSMPDPSRTIPSDRTEAKGRQCRTKMAILSAVFLFFLGQGVLWSYLGLIGTAAGIADQAVANSLALSQIAGALGALSLTWLSGRIRRHGLLLGGTIASIVPLLIMMSPMSLPIYGLSVILFNGAANVMTPLLIAIAAAVGDSAGRLVRRATALQMLGLAAGPAVAAQLTGRAGFHPLLLISSLLFAGACAAGLLSLPKSQSRAAAT